MAEWKESYIHRQADPNKVAEELESITLRTPHEIVEAAKNENTEMHKCFTWDEGAAAAKCRIQEARHMVDHLVIVYSCVEQEQTMEIIIPIFSSISTEDGRQYVRTSLGKGNEVLREMIKSEVRSLLSQAQRKMEAHRIFFSSEQVSEVKELMEQLEK